MQSKIRLPENAMNLLRCPVCHSRLICLDGKMECNNDACRSSFPVIDGIPILINEGTSIFSVEDFVLHRTTTLATGTPTFLKQILKGLLGE